LRRQARREELLDAFAWCKIKRSGSVRYCFITELKVEENLMTLNVLLALDICSQREGEGGTKLLQMRLVWLRWWDTRIPTSNVVGKYARENFDVAN